MKTIKILFIIMLFTICLSCSNDNTNYNKLNLYEMEITTMDYFNFNNEIKENETIKTKYNNKDLILIDMKQYDGPLTLQYLPFGGIQSIYNYNLIIHFINGYYAPSKIIYDNKEVEVKEFIINNPNLVNYILG